LIGLSRKKSNVLNFVKCGQEFINEHLHRRIKLSTGILICQPDLTAPAQEQGARLTVMHHRRKDFSQKNETVTKKESRYFTRGDTTYSKLKREPDANIVPRRTCFLAVNIYRWRWFFK